MYVINSEIKENKDYLQQYSYFKSKKYAFNTEF